MRQIFFDEAPLNHVTENILDYYQHRVSRIATESDYASFTPNEFHNADFLLVPMNYPTKVSMSEIISSITASVNDCKDEHNIRSLESIGPYYRLFSVCVRDEFIIDFAVIDFNGQDYSIESNGDPVLSSGLIQRSTERKVISKFHELAKSVVEGNILTFTITLDQGIMPDMEIMTNNGLTFIVTNNRRDNHE